ncbi:MAG: hypothetical protein SGILL_005191, partial [Bacillariaceae sp.]
MDPFNQAALSPDATSSLQFAPGSMKRVADLLVSAENVIDGSEHQTPMLNAFEPTPIGPNVQVSHDDAPAQAPTPTFDDIFLSRSFAGGMFSPGLLKSQNEKIMLQQQMFQNSSEFNPMQRMMLLQQMQQMQTQQHQPQMQAQPQMQQQQQQQQHQFPFVVTPTSMHSMPQPYIQTKKMNNTSPVAAMLNATPRKTVGPARKT